MKNDIEKKNIEEKDEIKLDEESEEDNSGFRAPWSALIVSLVIIILMIVCIIVIVNIK